MKQFLSTILANALLATASAVLAADTSGLVSRWSAEESARDSIGKNHGELRGEAGFAPGRVGRAFQFDGRATRVHLPDSATLVPTDSFTIEGWIQIHSWPSFQGIIILRGDDRSANDSYSVMTTPDGKLKFYFDAPGDLRESVATPVATNQWMHFAAVLDDAKSTISLYVDGALAAQEPITTRPLRAMMENHHPSGGIGNHGGEFWNFPFHGLIDELSLYSRALSPAEVFARYNAGMVAAGASPQSKGTPAATPSPSIAPGAKTRADFTIIQPQKNGRVQLRFTSSPGQVYIVQSSTNLIDWVNLGTAITVGDDLFEIEDPNSSPNTTRFYRIVSP